MRETRIAILYIATGKYTMFWKDFYKSCEQYFLNLPNYKKDYFIFTDAEDIEFGSNSNVHKIYQKQLSWPYITLDRFKIFQNARPELEKMDYIYFFNANMLFVDDVKEEILPTSDKPLILINHPGFFDKKRSEFTYEQNPKSLAYISQDQGRYYYMGGLSGGKRETYLSLIDELEKRIDIDKSNNIIAVWHDESHLNRYAIENEEEIRVLNPSYGYPEGWKLPFIPKIIIRDKKKYGGHVFLRNQDRGLKIILKKVLKW